MSVSYFMGQPVSGMCYLGMSVKALAQNGVTLWEKAGATDVDAWILEYLESDGNQYLTIPKPIDDQSIFETVYVLTETPTEYLFPFLTNAENSLWTDKIGAQVYNATIFYMHRITSSSGTNNIRVQTTNSVDLYEESCWKINQGLATLNDVPVEFSTYTGEYVAPDTVSIYFCYNIGCRILYAKQTNEFNSNRNFNIVMVEKDGVCQAWDAVDNTYYTNQGTGSFTGGDRIGYVKNGIAYNMDGTEMFPVEVDGYQLQSLSLSDGAYFDTGYYPIVRGTDTATKVIFQTPATSCFYGSRSSSGSCNVFLINGSFRFDVIGGVSGDLLEADTLYNYQYLSQERTCVVNDTSYTSSYTSTEIRIDNVYLIGHMTDNSGLVSSYPATTMTIVGNWDISEWVDGVEVPQRSYVPWYRESDGVVCLKNTLDGSYCEIVTGTITGGLPVASDE